MSAHYRVLIVGCLLALVGGACWTADHYHRLYQSQKTRAETAEQQASRAELITAHVLRLTSIFTAISEANQHGKARIARDASRAASDIHRAVAQDDCAARPVPAGAVKRLHDYAHGIPTGAGATTPGRADRTNTPAGYPAAADMGG